MTRTILITLAALFLSTAASATDEYGRHDRLSDPDFSAWSDEYGQANRLSSQHRSGMEEVITLRSGNGSGPEDSEITMLVGPADTPFAQPFTAQDFLDARSGPPAFLTTLHQQWLDALPTDPDAQWISTNTTGSTEAASALYAYDFALPDCAWPDAASLEMTFAIDNFLGNDPIQGVYINGQPISGTTPPGDYDIEQSFVRDDVVQLLQPGNNTLYVYQQDSGGPAGVIFTATLTVSFANDCNDNGVPDGCDISGSTSTDCNSNGIPDECDISDGTATDCNDNGLPDKCDISGGTSTDANYNGAPDECDTVHNVTQDTSHSTIQDAVDMAVNGDIIEVGPRRYVERIDLSNVSVTLRSTDGPDVTIIDGDAGGSVIRNQNWSLCNHQDIVINGFTLTNGYADMGGGIYVDSFDVALTVTNCIFAENISTYRGGGASLLTYDNITIRDCVFYGNIAPGGGGVFVQSSATIENCDIFQNIAVERGAGLYAYNENIGNLTLTNCRILANEVRPWHIPDWEPLNENRGGGMYNRYCDPTLVNCVFDRNYAHKHGGMMYNLHSSPTLVNCTIAENSCLQQGHQFYNITDSHPTLINCILASAEDPNCIVWGSSSTFDCTYSLVEGGWPGIGNIDADPRFVDDYNYNFRLLDDSPCINTGSNDAIPTGITTDNDGAVRIQHCRIDIGAYESSYPGLDCNSNGVGDECDIDPADPDGDGWTSMDCNTNSIPDECDIDPADPDGDGWVYLDCNENDSPDDCDIADGLSPDVNPADGIPDDCQGLPLEFGACCLVCDCVICTESACLDAGGQYQGTGLTCQQAACTFQCSADLNNDGDVDLSDFALFQQQYTGPLP